MIFIKVIILVILVLLTTIFAYFNLQIVTLSFFNYSFSAPLFLIVLGSFLIGVIVSGSISLFKVKYLRPNAEKLLRALNFLWNGYISKAGKELRKIKELEEAVPLLIETEKELGNIPHIYFQEYSQGIAETYFAKAVWKDDIDRAIEVLEKALGKNWENLNARRLLRDLYTIKGEFRKALDLQKGIVDRAEKELKEREKRILASLLIKNEMFEGIEDFPETPEVLAYLINRNEKKRKRYIEKAVNKGYFEETVLIMLERNLLVPEVLSKLEELRENISGAVLLKVYLELGMFDKAKELRTIPEGIRKFIESDMLSDKDCRDIILSYIKVWECEVCGKEFDKYSSLCDNCLSWNRLKIRGGS